MKQIFIFLILFFTNIGFSQVVINEVHPRPSGGDTDQAFQSMFNSTITYGSEFIEIYNTSPCDPVDISCWSIGGMDGGTNGGAFSFPAGTVIAPLSFITLGGPNTPGVTFNLNLAANNARLWHSAASRWHLPNGDGWVSLYNAAGVSVDAVYWTFSSNDPTKLNTDATFTSGVLQRHAVCGGGALSTASTIAGIEYISMATVTGQSFERTTDGGMTWALGSATPNNCNGTCVVGNAFLLNATAVQPSCGLSNGSISFNPSPAGTYTYVWTPNVSSTSSAGSLAAGNYSIQITNSSGCQVDTIITLVSTGGITGVNINSTNPTCGQSNGSISIGVVTGGTAPYQYNFNGAGLSGTTLYSNLVAGTYTLTVQDNVGCVYSSPNITLTNGSGPSAIVVNSSNTACGLNNGSVTLGTVSGGTAPYQYNFNGQGLGSTTNFTNLPAGVYSLSILDNVGCAYTAPTITILGSSSPIAITVITTNPICGQSNGSVSLGSVTGGVTPYQYNFNNLGLSGVTNYSNLSAGSYSLIVQDNLGCIFVAPNISLSNSGGPTDIVVNTVNPTCGQSNGSVTLGVVTGGVAPYQYNFNGSGLSSTTSFSNLGAGSYSLLVQDNTGCVLTSPNIVISSIGGPTSISVVSTDDNCGQSNGSVTLGTVSGGTSPYLYNFNGQGFAATTSFTNLQAGTYTVEVLDNGGCTYIAPPVNIINTPGPTAISVNLVNATCGQANAAVTLGVVTGGTAPYQYNFNNLGFAGTTFFSSLLDGTYPLSVQDANGCAFLAPSIVLTNSSSPSSVSVSVTDASCGGANGSVLLGGVVGGTAPYQYNFNGLGYSSTTNYINLSAGNFTLTVQDALGCIFSAPVIEVVTTTGPSDIILDPVDATCGLNDGSVTITSTFGGSAPYLYSWNGSGFTNTLSYVGLAPDSYQVIVQDAEGCSYQETVIIGGGTPPTADFAINPLAVSIWDANVNLINESSNDVVIYNWIIPDGNPSSGSTEDFETAFTGLNPGTYPVTLIVTNSSGCTDTVTKYVELYDEILVFAPNSFTPDGDEYNNLWNVFVSNADLTSFEVIIFDRWGEIIYHSFDSEIGWDGTFNGTYVQQGVYTWRLFLKDTRTDQKLEYLGHVNVIR
jgi:gliding motility-associated-like protein